MRMRRHKREEELGVMLSPMIDCVFLMLIFFLATSMIKRWERLIPLSLSDPTAAVEKTARKDVLELAVDRQGRLYAEAGQNSEGSIQFRPVGDAARFLDQTARTRGTDKPLQINVDPDAEFQQVIHVQDLIEEARFSRILFRSSDRPVSDRIRP